jgi:hypothetical protein
MKPLLRHAPRFAAVHRPASSASLDPLARLLRAAAAIPEAPASIARIQATGVAYPCPPKAQAYLLARFVSSRFSRSPSRIKRLRCSKSAVCSPCASPHINAFTAKFLPFQTSGQKGLALSSWLFGCDLLAGACSACLRRYDAHSHSVGGQGSIRPKCICEAHLAKLVLVTKR